MDEPPNLVSEFKPTVGFRLVFKYLLENLSNMPVSYNFFDGDGTTGDADLGTNERSPIASTWLS